MGDPLNPPSHHVPLLLQLLQCKASEWKDALSNMLLTGKTPISLYIYIYTYIYIYYICRIDLPEGVPRPSTSESVYNLDLRPLLDLLCSQSLWPRQSEVQPGRNSHCQGE